MHLDCLFEISPLSQIAQCCRELGGTPGGGGGVLPYMDYTGMCRSTGYGFCLQISVSCLECGILFAILTLEHGRGDYFAARIVVQTNVIAVPARVPLHVYSNTLFQIRRSTSCHVFQSGTGYLFSRICLEQGSEIASLWSGTGSGSQALSGTPPS